MGDQSHRSFLCSVADALSTLECIESVLGQCEAADTDALANVQAVGDATHMNRAKLDEIGAKRLAQQEQLRMLEVDE